MGDVVNLNKFRKRKRRERAERTADHNRLKHGRTKAERAADQRERRRAKQHLDQHRLTPHEDSNQGDEPSDPQ